MDYLIFGILFLIVSVFQFIRWFNTGRYFYIWLSIFSVVCGIILVTWGWRR